MADITYCGHHECTSKECMRHYAHAPSGRPVSWAMFDCPYMPLDDFDGYVKVVRCKDCKGCTTVKGEITREIRWFCEVWRGHPQVNPMGYCSYGERRNNE